MTDSLIQLAIELTRIIIPIIMVVGIIGNSLNIAVLTRPLLYNYASSRYFLARGCNNLFFTSVVLAYFLLANGYQHDIENISFLSCKLVSYCTQVCVLFSTYFIVLASIDRYCASSTSAYLRSFSSIKLARWTILIDLRPEDAFGCRIRGDTIYRKIYPIIYKLLYSQ